MAKTRSPKTRTSPPSSESVVVIVDAFSAGGSLAREIHSHGFRLVHVQSSTKVPAFLLATKPELLFEQEYIYREDLIRILAAQKPICVIAGAETGVLIADLLSEQLGLRTNGTALSNSRRCKFEMKSALVKAGVPCANFFKTREWASARDILEADFEFPIVVKPMASSGSDGVTLCQDFKSAQLAFHAILQNQSKLLGTSNQEVLFEQYLHGDEYIVDTVSLEGAHYVTDISISRKTLSTDGRPLYESIELLDSTGKIQDELVSYFKRALDALGIKNGPAHGEIILTDKGPRLVEVGARLAGAGMTDIFGKLTSYPALEAAADAYLRPEIFLERVTKPYVIKHYACMVFIQSYAKGYLSGLPNQWDLESMKSFEKLSWRYKVGEQIERTVDLYTSPGYILLAHKDPKIINTDRVFFRLKIESQLNQDIVVARKVRSA